MLLVTTTVQKRVGLGLRVAGTGQQSLPGKGAVTRLQVEVRGAALSVVAELRQTDVTASQADTEIRRVALPPRGQDLDLAGLQATLRELKTLDPGRDRVSLLPDDEVAAGDLVALLDAVRADRAGSLFPSPMLGALP